jgi:hypothetical protein
MTHRIPVLAGASCGLHTRARATAVILLLSGRIVCPFVLSFPSGRPGKYLDSGKAGRYTKLEIACQAQNARVKRRLRPLGISKSRQLFFISALRY